MQRGYSYQNITTNTTTTVKSGAGILQRLVVNTPGSADATTTVYDNTTGSGTKIATVNHGFYPVTLEFDVRFATGLTLVTAGSTPGNITVIYE